MGHLTVAFTRRMKMTMVSTISLVHMRPTRLSTTIEVRGDILSYRENPTSPTFNPLLYRPLPPSVLHALRPLPKSTLRMLIPITSIISVSHHPYHHLQRHLPHSPQLTLCTLARGQSQTRTVAQDRHHHLGLSTCRALLAGALLLLLVHL